MNLRLLIKHLPKQMSKLRHDKAELEERIQELEARLHRQTQDMQEWERRAISAAATAAAQQQRPVVESDGNVEAALNVEGGNGIVRLKFRAKEAKVLNH